jgi:hypothetical protein
VRTSREPAFHLLLFLYFRPWLDPKLIKALVLNPTAKDEVGEAGRGLLSWLQPPTGTKGPSLVPIGGFNRD